MKDEKVFITFRVTKEEAIRIQEMADRWARGNKSIFLREMAKNINVKRAKKINGVEFLMLYGKVPNAFFH